jgi:hypothetical protein
MFNLMDAASWIQFGVLLISIITVGVKVGKFMGMQEQINKNQTDKNAEFEEADKKHDKDIKELDAKINKTERTLVEKIDKVGLDVEFIKGKIGG